MQVCAALDQQRTDADVAIFRRKGQGAGSVDGTGVDICPPDQQDGDGGHAVGLDGHHECSLAELIGGVDIGTRIKVILDGLDISGRGREPHLAIQVCVRMHRSCRVQRQQDQ